MASMALPPPFLSDTDNLKPACYHFPHFCRRCAIMRGKLEILALVLGVIGLVGTIAVTAMPMWRVTAFIGSNLIVMEMQWEGLWMACIRQADINMQCKVYDSLLILPADIQAAPGLMCTSIGLVVLAVLVSILGIRGTNCWHDDVRGKNMFLVVGGCLFIVAFLAALLPVTWSTHNIIRHSYNPAVIESQKHEIGQSLYVGFATFFIFVVAGVILLCHYATHHRKEEKKYISTIEERSDVAMLSRTLFRKSRYV